MDPKEKQNIKYLMCGFDKDSLEHFDQMEGVFQVCEDWEGMGLLIKPKGCAETIEGEALFDFISTRLDFLEIHWYWDKDERKLYGYLEPPEYTIKALEEDVLSLCGSWVPSDVINTLHEKYKNIEW